MRNCAINPAWILLAALVLSGGVARAVDHSNLDEGRPLRLDDAYSISHRELEIEAGVGFSLNRASDGGFFIPIEFLWGAYPNLQVEAGAEYSIESGGAGAEFGDITLGALYNFNQETLAIPAFGLRIEGNIPTGDDSSGAGFKVKGIMTKSVGRLGVHTNIAYEYLNGNRDAERDSRFELLLGGSYPIGAPGFTRLTILGDVFGDISAQRADASVAGGEVGIRYQLSQRAVFDLGGGSEVIGARERARFYITAGISVAL
ncbi:MAG: transporter [Deltaproteobacteria bacterium]